jgi:tRNA modification GTPase
VCTSARAGTGLEELKSAIRDGLGDHAASGEDRAVLLNARQRSELSAASEALERAEAEAGQIRETIDRADVIAFELREALEAVGSVCGSVTTEELLGQVFANFCIGK